MDALSDLAGERQPDGDRGRGPGADGELPGSPAGQLRRAGDDQLPRDEERDLRRGRGAARQRPSLSRAAELLREKGTDRSRFERGEVDRYTWRDIGSSLRDQRAQRRLPLGAARGGAVVHRAPPGDLGPLPRGPSRCSSAAARCAGARGYPPECGQNGHLYSLLLEDRDARDALISHLKRQGDRRRLPLRPAARLAGRAPARPRRRRAARDRERQRPAGAAAALARPAASSRTR